MTVLSRRTILRATVATSALAAAPVALASTTAAADPVIILGREHDTADERERLAAENGDEAENYIAALARLAICGRIAATPATTLAGLAVKLRIVRTDMEEGETEHTDAIMKSAIADTERLAGGAS